MWVFLEVVHHKVLWYQVTSKVVYARGHMCPWYLLLALQREFAMIAEEVGETNKKQPNSR